MWSGRHRKFAAWDDARLGVLFYVDLGELEDVGDIAVRLTGGNAAAGVAFPSEIIAIASNDGETFYEAAKLIKVNHAEKELAEDHPDQYFYIPDENRTTVQPFVLDVNRKARYIGVSIRSTEPLLATDEFAVMRAREGHEVKPLYGLPAIPSPTRPKIVPQAPELVITTNVATPSWFYVTGADAASDRFVFDLPSGVSIHAALNLNGQPLVATKDPTTPGNRWIVEGRVYLKWTGRHVLGPLYFILDESAEIEDDAVASMFVQGQDATEATTTNLRTIEIPRVPPITELDVSFGWLRLRSFLNSPDGLALYRQCGFNAVPVFPYYNKPPERLEAFIHEARMNGFEIIMVDNTIHHMISMYRDKKEILNQVDGKPGNYVCPSYTGKYYQAEIERVGKQARWVKPDFIFYDIETFLTPVMEEARKCSRCLNKFADSGHATLEAFFQAQGTRLMRDLHKATQGSTPEGSNPIAGLYSSTAVPPVFEIFDFDQIHPAYVQIGQPHLYFAGDIERIHDRVRANYGKLEKRFLIPWLTAGTFGKIPSYKMEQIILECFLNGARGVTHYRYDDYDPMDFYYHAVAMKRLAPFQLLLKNGHLIEVHADNEDLACSAFGNDQEALVLLGNYSGAEDAVTRLDFGPREVASVTNLMNGQPLALAESEEFRIGPGMHLLLHVVFEEIAL